MIANRKDQKNEVIQSKIKLAAVNQVIRKIIRDYAQAIDEAKLKKIKKDLK